MHAYTLKLDDLRVETFATESLSRDTATPGMMNTRTMWPKDCPETLPRFC